MVPPASKRDRPENRHTVPPCKACGGTDHQRRSSKKCKFYNINELETANDAIVVANNDANEVDAKYELDILFYNLIL